MKKFTSIESFTHLVRKMKAHADYLEVPVQTLPTRKFRGTVKLHGTNAGVRVEVDGTVDAQSRTEILHPKNTNFGWSTFVYQIGTIWNSLTQRLLLENGISVQTEPVTIYGEWCGQGIQKGVGVSNAPKHFVIFGIAHGDVMLETIGVPDISLNGQGIYWITQVPTYEVVIDPNDFQAASDILNELTLQVETQCPWAKTMFDIDGIGEGIVWVPIDAPYDTNLYFKTKGDKHKVRSSPTKDVAPVDVEKVNSIKEYVNIVLTENRMEQMVNDNKLPLDPKSIGPFLKALSEDILKEESILLQENGLEWKEVGKLVQMMARTWFLEKITQATMA